MATENWIRLRCQDAIFRGHRHQLASEAVAELGESWDSYFSFGFVRNPWARLVSWWSMIQEHPTQNHHLPFWQYIRKNGPTFHEFILNCTETIEDDGTTKSAIRSQLDYLADANGLSLVSFVGRYESLQSDLNKIADLTGLPRGVSIITNRSPHTKDYRNYYTSETRAIVAERFARDIDSFEYMF